MSDESRRLVRAAGAKLGVASPGELQDFLRLGGTAYGKVNRWWSGASAPDHAATMMLLERCGWLTAEFSQAIQAEVEAELEQAARDVAAALEAIQGDDAPQSGQQPQPHGKPHAQRRRRTA